MDNCIHHWDLGASHKGIVHAKCRKCGAEKDYYNNPVFKPGAFGGNKKVAPLPTIPTSNTPYSSWIHLQAEFGWYNWDKTVKRRHYDNLQVLFKKILDRQISFDLYGPDTDIDKRPTNPLFSSK